MSRFVLAFILYVQLQFRSALSPNLLPIFCISVGISLRPQAGVLIPTSNIPA